jgi:hypothetical protein
MFGEEEKDETRKEDQKCCHIRVCYRRKKIDKVLKRKIVYRRSKVRSLTDPRRITPQRLAPWISTDIHSNSPPVMWIYLPKRTFRPRI